MAKEAQAKARAAKSGLPDGVKIVDGQEQPLDAATIHILMEGWNIKRTIDDAKARLDEINAQLIKSHGTGCALVVTGICRASLAARQTVKVADPDRLEAVLGDRFDDLVSESVSYKAEQKLIEMASDADDPLQPAIAACLSITESQAVTWRAER